MAMLGAAAGLASAGLNAYGEIQKGGMASAAGRYQQNADIARGKEDVGDAQRLAIQKYNQGDVLASKAAASAAASGAGVTGTAPTMAEIYEQTRMAGGSAVAKGQMQQQALEAEGKAARLQGDAAAAMAPWNAASAAIGPLAKVDWSGAKNSFSNIFS
jgi:hypothetical protein